MAQLMQANLAEIGVTMEIVQREEGALTEFTYGEAPAEERPHFQSWGWWPDYNDAHNEMYPNFHTNSIVPNGSNAGYYSNAEFDALLDSVELGAPEDEYNKAIADANDILVRTDPAAIFYGSWQWYTVIQPNIRGFVPNPIYINTYNVYDMYREE
jgi:peptide/nickel transport system substrate-binding protein